MTRLLYFVRKALGEMRAAPFVHLVSALTVAVALVLAAVAGAVALQARALLEGWGLVVELTLYLDPEVGPEAAEALVAKAAGMAGGTARHVPPAEALARLAASLGADAALLEGLEGNPLPPSIEVVPAGARSARDVAALAARLADLPGVADVDYGREWIDRVARLGIAARIVASVVLPLVLLGAAVLAGSVVRLGVWARREEIAIMKLVGATDAFVRAPFLVEGFLAGGRRGAGSPPGPSPGSPAGSGRSWPWRCRSPPSCTRWPLASPENLLLVAGAGALLGVVASAVSVGRHLEV